MGDLVCFACKRTDCEHAYPANLPPIAKTVCVFGGAKGNATAIKTALECAELLRDRGVGVVYGGGRKGVMGAVRATMGANRCVGIVPAVLVRKFGVSTEGNVVTQGWEERRNHFWQADAFLCLPGGFGSMVELFECADYMRLGIIDRKPLVVVNDGGWADGIKVLVGDMMRVGVLHESDIRFLETPKQAVDFICPVNNAAPATQNAATRYDY